MKKVIAAHWKDSGVSAADAFDFWIKPVTTGSVVLVVKGAFGTRTAPVALQAGPWQNARVPLPSLQLKDDDLAKIEGVGFLNSSRAMQAFVLDEFLLRP